MVNIIVKFMFQYWIEISLQWIEQIEFYNCTAWNFVHSWFVLYISLQFEQILLNIIVMYYILNGNESSIICYFGHIVVFLHFCTICLNTGLHIITAVFVKITYDCLMTLCCTPFKLQYAQWQCTLHVWQQPVYLPAAEHLH